jgi:hypothetical protein
MTKLIVTMVVTGVVLASSLTVRTAGAAAQPVSGPVIEHMRPTFPTFPTVCWNPGAKAAHKHRNPVVVPGGKDRPNTLGFQGQRLHRVRPPIRFPNG